MKHFKELKDDEAPTAQIKAAKARIKEAQAELKTAKAKATVTNQTIIVEVLKSKLESSQMPVHDERELLHSQNPEEAENGEVEFPPGTG